MLEAARLGLPKKGLVRMLLRSLLANTVLGALFDATWKTNSHNVALLEAHAERLTFRQKPNYGFMLLFTVLLILFVVAVGAIALWTTTSILKLITPSPS